MSSLQLPAWGMAASVLLALFAPLLRGGNRHVPLVLLEALGLLVLLSMAWVWLGRTQQRMEPGVEPLPSAKLRLSALALLLSSPVWLGLLYLAHLPGAGHAALGLAPTHAEGALLAAVPVLACLAVGLWSSWRQVQWLVVLWVAVAAFQAVLGLLQLGGWAALYFGPVGDQKVLGSYASKNTYSNLLVMALPLVMNTWLFQHSAWAGAWNRKHSLWWGLGLLMLLTTTLLLANSRMGIATGGLVLVLSLLLLRPAARGAWLGLPWAVWLVAVFLLLALAVGGLDWLARFDADRVVADSQIRSLNRQATWQGALDFLPFGVGPGAYAGAFAHYQPPEMGHKVVDLAHNDYLQFFMELGLAAALLAAALLALVLPALGQLLRARKQPGGWNRHDRLGVACALALLATALHAWVDYPLRIPANAMLASFLLGVLLRQGAQRGTRVRAVLQPQTSWPSTGR